MTEGLLQNVPAALWWCLGGVGVLLVPLLLWRPLKRLARLALRVGLGVAALAVWAPVGGAVGIPLGVNLLNGTVLGLLGVPGFGLLLMLNWAL